MNRRHLLLAALLPLLPRPTTAQMPLASPAPFTDVSPIDLGDGLRLVDLRWFPVNDEPRLIGEIVSTRDDLIDPPAFTGQFDDAAGSRFWLHPIESAIWPGRSTMASGLAPETDPSAPLPAVRSVSRCAEISRVIIDHDYTGADLRVTDWALEERAYGTLARGTVTNNGTAAFSPTLALAYLRDRDGRYCGITTGSHLGGIAAGADKTFAYWAIGTAGELYAAPVLYDPTAHDVTLEPRFLIDRYVTPVYCGLAER